MPRRHEANPYDVKGNSGGHGSALTAPRVAAGPWRRSPREKGEGMARRRALPFWCVHASVWRMRGALGRAIAAFFPAPGRAFSEACSSLAVSQLLAGDRSVPGRSPGAARRCGFASPATRRRRTETKPRFPLRRPTEGTRRNRAAYPSSSSRLTTPREGDYPVLDWQLLTCHTLSVAGERLMASRPKPVHQMTASQFDALFLMRTPAKGIWLPAVGASRGLDARAAAAAKCSRLRRCRSNGSATPARRSRLSVLAYRGHHL